MNRKVLWSVFAIGLALVLAPLALSLPGKSAAGERMIGSFEPIMQPGKVKTTAYYYDEVFAPLGEVTPMMSAPNLQQFQGYLKGFDGMQTDAAMLVPLLAQALQTTPAEVQALLEQQLPAMAAVLEGLPAMQRDFGGLLGTMQQNVDIFGQVPAGLLHYRPLVATMQANVDDYEQVSSLPDFRLFSVFFIVPGVLLVVLSAFGLFGAALAGKISFHHHPRPTSA